MEQRDSNFSILNRPPMPRTRSVEDIYASPTPSLAKPQGVNWGRVTGITQDVEAMRRAYQQGGAGYAIGDALNRGARSLGSSAGQLFDQGVMPPVRSTAGFFGGLGRGVIGMEPASSDPTTQITDQQSPGGAVAGPTLAKPAALTQADMLAEQNEGLVKPTLVGKLPEDARNIGSPYGMSGTLYANLTPPKGYGNAIYSDSQEGARGFSGGALVKPHGSGPFGRSMATQQKIMERVQAYNNATEMYKSMRGASDTGRRRRELESRAGSNVSLNQGLGSFLSNAANRNLARKDLAILNEQENDAAKVATDQASQNARMGIELAKLQKPEFKAVDVPYGEVDPISGKQQSRQLLINPMSGQMVDPLNALGSTSRAAPVEAVADLKEMLAAAKTEADKQRLMAQFSEVFDLPDGLLEEGE